MARSRQSPKPAPTTRRSLRAGLLPADERVGLERAPGEPDENRSSTASPPLVGRAAEYWTRRRRSARVPVGNPIQLKFDDSTDVVDGICEDISIGGIFVQLTECRTQGSVARFELQLDNGSVLRGLGEIVWNRTSETGTGRRIGSGIKFRFLEEKDQQLVREMVDLHTGHRPAKGQSAHRRGSGGTSAPRAQAAAAETAVGIEPVAEPVTPEPHQRSRPAREAGPDKGWWRQHSRIVLPLGALTVGSFLLLLGDMKSKPRPTVSARAPAVAPPVAVEEQEPVLTSTPAIPEAAEVAGAADVAEPGDVEQEILNLAQAWAKAWSDQRVDDYLGFYAADFRPPRKMDRSAWEDLRRSRITKPRYIEITLDAVELALLSGGRARVSFEQTYRSDSYRDTVRKSFELVRGDGDWKILVESVE